MDEGDNRPCLGPCGKMRWSDNRGDRVCKACKKKQYGIVKQGKRATQSSGSSPHVRKELLDN